MDDLVNLTITEASVMLKQGHISPVELTQAHLDQIEALDRHVNAFITLTAESAFNRARQAEEEISRGQYLGPLHGIPIALKDLFYTKEVLTTSGSSFFSSFVPEADGAVVQKLKSAGVVVLGKLNMHEIALGVTNENPHFGDCCNPWALERISGGSSGGSAAALAARMCMGAMGSDTGGSIRIPSSLCGVIGLKPTYGRISLGGVTPLSWNLDHAGPMARSVEDVTHLLQAVAGYDPEDPASANIHVPDYRAGLKIGIRGLRVALATGEFFEEADSEVLLAVRAAAQVFSGLGAHVTEAEVPWALEAARANGLMVTSDAAAVHQERLETNPEGFGTDVCERLQSGAAYTSTEYVLARRVQAETRKSFERFFEAYDLLLTPATPLVAPFRSSLGAAKRAPQLTRFTAPFNLAGLPALVLPCGFTTQGLPVGLQVVGRHWDEETILRAAYAYENASDWRRVRPALSQRTAS
jgi:aspartyl-tRNA(Asn)/glutamyl-tRNA(Gln) amidotransferase subunit A